MEFLGVSAAGLRRDYRVSSEGELRSGPFHDCKYDFPAGSHHGSQVNLRRHL